MSEPGAASEAGDGTAERFRRIYDHLRAIAAEVTEIRRTTIMIMSGSDLNTVVDIEHDEHDLERDVHRLQMMLQAHVE